jgi:hypothetical protein
MSRCLPVVILEQCCPRNAWWEESCVKPASETPVIHVILEKGIAPIATVHHVANRSRIFHSQLARHAWRVAPSGGCNQLKL